MSAPCRLMEERFLAQGDEALSDGRELERHLAACPQCASFVDSLRMVSSGLAVLSRAEVPMVSIDGAVVSKAASNPAANAEESAWHVEVGESSDAVSVSVLERLWEDGAVQADTLVWRAGMPDWAELRLVAELAYILSLPRVTPEGAAPAPSVNGTATLPGHAHDRAEEVGFAPLAAAGLSALMASELEGSATRPPPAAPPRVSPDKSFDLPADLPRPPEPWAGGVDISAAPSASWSVPVPKAKQGPRALPWLIGLGGSAVVAAAMAMVLVVMRPGLPPSSPVAPVATAQAPVQNPAQVPPGVAPAAQPPAAARQERPVEEAKPRPGRNRREAVSKADKRGRAGSAAPAAAPAPAPAAARAPLQKGDIVAGVKKNASSLVPCLKEARARNEMPAGQYTFTLDWTINADGSISNGRLKGPPSVMNGSLPSCFLRVMRGWSFAPSDRATPIANFPLGPITLP
jgi:hypothetical protein